MDRFEDAAREFGAGLISETGVERRAAWLAYIAYAHYLGRNPEGKALARDAYAKIPWRDVALAAHAAWLAEFGEAEKTLEVLTRGTWRVSAVVESLNPIAAIAHAQLGRIKLARRLHAVAQKAPVPPALVRRIEEALKAAE